MLKDKNKLAERRVFAANKNVYVYNFVLIVASLNVQIVEGYSRVNVTTWKKILEVNHIFDRINVSDAEAARTIVLKDPTYNDTNSERGGRIDFFLLGSFGMKNIYFGQVIHDFFLYLSLALWEDKACRCAGR